MPYGITARSVYYCHCMCTVLQYSPQAPVYADSLVAAMANATVSDTLKHSSPDAASDVDVSGEVEAKDDRPVLTSE